MRKKIDEAFLCVNLIKNLVDSNILLDYTENRFTGLNQVPKGDGKKL
ncbi:hypothetical protein NCCP2050_27560 [Planococcus sp. NCCP-2050]|nr:hypothetical protein NCCP2050_27560 [Planococcus sp. NCCP-2050]